MKNNKLFAYVLSISYDYCNHERPPLRFMAKMLHIIQSINYNPHTNTIKGLFYEVFWVIHIFFSFLKSKGIEI